LHKRAINQLTKLKDEWEKINPILFFLGERRGRERERERIFGREINK
jgi:hypothetical protein